MIKKILSGILLSLAVSTVFLFGLEFLLRTTHLFGAHITWAVTDPVLGWKMAPSQEFWSFEENTHPIRWRTNSFRWKDREWTLSKPENTYRIAVLGDSYVEATQVEPDRNFLADLEKDLPRLGSKRVEYMNFGRSGFSQAEEYLVLQNDIRPFSPDMLILLFYPCNDITDASAQTALETVRPYYHLSANGDLVPDMSFTQTRMFKIRSMMNWLKRHSALVTFISRRISIYRQQKKADTNFKNTPSEESGIPLQGYLSLCTRHPDPQFAANYKLVKRIIEAMAGFCKARNIRFLLVTIDLPSYLPEFDKTYRAKDPTFDGFFFEKDMDRFAKEIGIEHLGLQSVFTSAYTSSKIPYHWQHWGFNGRQQHFEYGGHYGHWNYEGHRLVAEALRRKIIAMTAGPQAVGSPSGPDTAPVTNGKIVSGQTSPAEFSR